MNICTHKRVQKKIIRACIYAYCVCVYTGLSMKITLVAHYYLMNFSFKLHKDQSFHCRDICKMVLTFKIINFQCIFHIFTVMHLQSFQRRKITELFLNVYETDIKISQSYRQKDVFLKL